jgi:endonuclease YncB( thermonuclease family)
MLIRLASGLAAIFTVSWRAGPLAGPAKVIDGDTVVVAGELVRLHGLDAPSWIRPSGGGASASPAA